MNTPKRIFHNSFKFSRLARIKALVAIDEMKGYVPKIEPLPAHIPPTKIDSRSPGLYVLIKSILP